LRVPRGSEEKACNYSHFIGLKSSLHISRPVVLQSLAEPKHVAHILEEVMRKHVTIHILLELNLTCT